MERRPYFYAIFKDIETVEDCPLCLDGVCTICGAAVAEKRCGCGHLMRWHDKQWPDRCSVCIRRYGSSPCATLELSKDSE